MTTEMDCAAARIGLSPYIDGELDAAERAAFERHLAGCASCREALAEAQALSRGLRSDVARERAPEALAARLRDAWDRADRRVAPRPWFMLAPALAAASILLLVAGVVIGRWGLPPAAELGQMQVAARDALAAHVRSLVGERTIDVASSDRHTVKPWFEGRVEVAPPVVDLAADGFPLAGGRVDFVGGRRVAALVYRYRLHVVTLFVGPSTVATGGEMEAQGYRVVAWSQGGLSFWAVSDTDRGELERFAATYRARIAAN